MDELLEAIYTRFTSATGDAARAIITGGMYLGIAEDGVSDPYATFNIVSNFESDAIVPATIQYLNPLIQFSVWDSNTDPINAIAGSEALRDLYRDVILSLTNWTVSMAQVEQPMTPTWDDETKSWGVHFDIHYMIGK